MRLLFWSSLSLIFFAYGGYPIWMYCRARLWPHPIWRAIIFPQVSIVLAVRNEEKHLSAKLANLAALDYPADRVEVIVVSDGSTDATNKILAGWKSCNRRALFLPEHHGKAAALNHGVAEARGEIVVFTDARQMIASNALKNLVADFADPSVGCVSGELVISENPNTPSTHGVGMYWRLEKKIRDWEGHTGSSVGATGAFYAVRKHLFSTLPPETILDDVYIPLQVVRQGQRVVLERLALAWDDFVPSVKQEFRRKVRTLAGNYQLLQLTPWVVTHSNPVRFQFVCHKVLRLFVPFALLGLLVSTMWLRKGVYEVALGFQLAFYALAILSAPRAQVGIVSRLSNISLAFLVLNAAAAIAFLYFITGRKAAWAR
jgi:biofilm PGA synthesis N-glycosyltransferase PgaC